ncbi:MAG: hypothetical protein ABSD20_17565 [Terriglobales bacterium]
MKVQALLSSVVILGAMALLCAGSTTAFAAEPARKKPSAKVIELDAQGKDYLSVLGGPPESVKGEMVFKDRPSLPVEANHAIYCPPQTEHDVKNTGTRMLRYVYVVADAK